MFPTMNPLRTTFAAAVACGLLFSAASAWADTKDYQFTGPIVSMTDTTLVVQKGKENWEFAKDAATKLPADAKVGDKVTVHYVMHAEAVDVSAASPKKPSKDKSKKSADAAPAADTAPPAATPKP